MVRSNSMNFVKALGLLSILLSMATPATATWRSARPERGTPSARLLPENGSAENQEPGLAEIRKLPSYYYLAQGDTLVIPMLGEGDLRVRMRPVYGSESEAGSFRYAVAFGRVATRNFKRKAPLEGAFRMLDARGWPPPSGNEMLLGEENRNDLNVPAGTDTVRIWMRGEGNGGFARIYYTGNLRQPERRKRSSDRWSWRPRRDPVTVNLLLAGYDSNANISPVDEGLEVAAGYWPAKIGGGVRIEPARYFSLGARYGYETERYENSVFDSNAHMLTLDQTWRRRIRPGGSHLVFSLTERYKSRDKTFFGRGNEEEFETSATELGADAASTVSEADRFDYSELRYGSSLDLHIGKRWTLSAGYSYADKDYNEDYDTYPGIYSIDYTMRRAEGGITWRPRPEWKIEWVARQSDKDYREKFSRSAAGDVVESAPTSLRGRKNSLALARKPRAGLIVEAGLSRLANEDLYKGYWDYDQSVWKLELGWRWRARHKVQLAYRSSSSDYANAHLDYDPLQPLRVKGSTQFRVDGNYRLSPRVELRAFWNSKDVENNSPTFAYRRSTLGGGLVLKF